MRGTHEKSLGTLTMRILIDTSSWLDFMRKGADDQPDVAAALLARTASICPPLWLELWSRARGKKEGIDLTGIRETCH